MKLRLRPEDALRLRTAARESGVDLSEYVAPLDVNLRIEREEERKRLRNVALETQFTTPQSARSAAP